MSNKRAYNLMVKSGDIVDVTMLSSSTTITVKHNSSGNADLQFSATAPYDANVELREDSPDVRFVKRRITPTLVSSASPCPGSFAKVIYNGSSVVSDGSSDDEYSPEQIGLMWIQSVDGEVGGYWLQELGELSAEEKRNAKFHGKTTKLRWQWSFTDDYAKVPLSDLDSEASWSADTLQIEWTDENDEQQTFPSNNSSSIMQRIKKSYKNTRAITWSMIRTIAKDQVKVFLQDAALDNERDAAIREATPLESADDIVALWEKHF